MHTAILQPQKTKSTKRLTLIIPCTHGKTRQEAIHNGEEVIAMYLEAWEAEGESIPEASTMQIAS